MSEQKFIHGENEIVTSVKQLSTSEYRVLVGETSYDIELIERDGSNLKVRIGDRVKRIHVSSTDHKIAVQHKGHALHFKRVDASGGAGHDHDSGAADPEIRAPMPGTIVKMNCKVGDEVAANASLVVMEAMKMEYVLTAPLPGKVVEVNCSEGGKVNLGDVMIRLEFAEADTSGN